MLKSIFVLCPSLLICFSILAQVPEDALRLSFTHPSGTAREQAIGGAMGSLGGDLSANFVNPAGLGFYKVGELLFTPSYSFSGSNASYLLNNSKGGSTNQFNVSTSGLVYAEVNSPGNSNAFSIAVTRSADFNGHTFYKGNNNYSSATEAYVSEFESSGLSVNDALSSPNLTYGTRSALYTYLIDTSMGGLGPVISQPGKVLAAGGSLQQSTDIISSGGITELAFSVAGGIHDKWYWGGSVGVPILSYKHTVTYTETDNGANPNNDFSTYSYTEYYSASGAAFNFKLGGIFRPNLNWRFGLAVHTPSIWGITDKLSTKMVTNTEGYHGIDSINSAPLDQASNTSNTINYDVEGPWHFLVSGSYIFPGTQVEGKMGFITADIEYVTYTSPNFYFPLDDNGNSPDNSYYDPLNKAIKASYKNNFNFRLGGEYKVDELAFRLGGSYSMNPYSSADLKGSYSTISGGVGYRKKGIFIDLTYVELIKKDVNFPYRLTDKENVYATTRQNTGSIILTMGFKF